MPPPLANTARTCYCVPRSFSLSIYISTRIRWIKLTATCYRRRISLAIVYLVYDFDKSHARSARYCTFTILELLYLAILCTILSRLYCIIVQILSLNPCEKTKYRSLNIVTDNNFFSKICTRIDGRFVLNCFFQRVHLLFVCF